MEEIMKVLKQEVETQGNWTNGIFVGQRYQEV